MVKEGQRVVTLFTIQWLRFLLHLQTMVTWPFSTANNSVNLTVTGVFNGLFESLLRQEELLVVEFVKNAFLIPKIDRKIQVGKY